MACSVTISKNAHAPHKAPTSAFVASLGSFGEIMAGAKDIDQFPDKEAKARFEAALKGATNTPHKPLKEKPKVKKGTSEERARQVSRAPNVGSGLLLIAGRVQGVPQISFDVQPFGTVTANDEYADVCGPMAPNGLKGMVPLKLIIKAPL
jgi:hypothetical protein